MDIAYYVNDIVGFLGLLLFAYMVWQAPAGKRILWFFCGLFTYWAAFESVVLLAKLVVFLGGREV